MPIRIPSCQFPQRSTDFRMTSHPRIHGNCFTGEGTEIDLVTVLASMDKGAAVVVEETDLTHAFFVVVEYFCCVRDRPE